MTEQAQGLEAALDRAQADADGAIKATANLARELKKAKSSASTGQLRDLTRALEQVESLATELAQQVARARAAYDVDETEQLASGAYIKELLAAASDAGLGMFEEDGRLLCYPSLVRVLPGDLAIEIDRRRERRIRPSVVVQQLAKAQQAGPRFRAAAFLKSLAAAYDLVVAGQGKPGGTVVRLLDLYAVLTLLPGQRSDYGKQEFARDLYLLDLDGATETGDRTLRWSASTGTKQAGVLTTVARSGQQQRYWGVAFDPRRDGTESGRTGTAAPPPERS